jgi:hypothetical protein
MEVISMSWIDDGIEFIRAQYNTAKNAVETVKASEAYRAAVERYNEIVERIRAICTTIQDFSDFIDEMYRAHKLGEAIYNEAKKGFVAFASKIRRAFAFLFQEN